MDCYACDQPAINACKRCASAYCEDHGNAQYCSECLKPASALPSLNLYRGALLAMLIGTAIAVYLLLRPPGETDSAPPVIVGRTTATATPRGGNQTPTTTARTPDGTTTPAGTPTPARSATASPFGEHVVVEGDTLFSIAEANLPVGDDLAAYVTAIANLNGIAEDAILELGDTIVLPPAAGLAVDDPEASARAGLRRSMIIYFLLFAAAAAVVYYILGAGVTGFGYVTLSVVGVVALMLGYQVYAHFRDLNAPLAESEGLVLRKWARADLIVAMQSHYIMVGRSVFRVRPDDWVLIEPEMYVKIVHFPRTLNVVTIHVTPSA